MRCQNIWLENVRYHSFISTYTNKIALYLKWIKIYILCSVEYSIINLSAFDIWSILLVPSLLADARYVTRVHEILLNYQNSLHAVLIYDHISFINQYIFQFGLDECFYQVTGRKLAGVLQYPSTSCSLIWLEIWRVFKFAAGSIVSLLAYFMVAV